MNNPICAGKVGKFVNTEMARNANTEGLVTNEGGCEPICNSPFAISIFVHEI